MAWIFNDKISKPVVKHDGKCVNRAQHKFCPYWMAKHSAQNKSTIIGYKCSLFKEDKIGYNSLPECNEKYGTTYQNNP